MAPGPSFLINPADTMPDLQRAASSPTSSYSGVNAVRADIGSQQAPGHADDQGGSDAAAAVSSSSQHKWCAICGSIIEPPPSASAGEDGSGSSAGAHALQEPDSASASAGHTASSSMAAASAPSPSSIAFAPPGSAASSLAQVLLQQGTNALLAASGGSNSHHHRHHSIHEVDMQVYTDAQGWPICGSCAAARDAEDAAERLERIRTPMDIDGESRLDDAGDAGMTRTASIPAGAEVQSATGRPSSMMQAGPNTSFPPLPRASSSSTSPTRIRTRSRTNDPSTNADNQNASTVSFGIPEEQIATWEPSSAEQRHQQASAPASTSPLGRSGSFTRSQAGISAHGSGLDWPEQQASSAPLVNFGRARTHSIGSSSAAAGPSASAPAGTGTAATAASRTRRTSSARRLSRSASAASTSLVTRQSVAFAADFASAAATAADSTSVETRYTPAGMTRPRLSTLRTSDTSLMSTLREQVINPLAVPYVREGEKDEEEKSGNASLATRRCAHEKAWAETKYFDPTKLDPLMDVSLKRLPPRGIGCLYPGALFTGTQKSGRSTYDVSVRIVNVDLAASSLCGYLNIRGLTEDWPELTTYFDAEIIGSKHGFLTHKWGATEADDLKHWSRFAPFRPLKSSLAKPALTFNHVNKPFVFMRWKERFLVPDHRLRERDITGASYAGFYYVCVELGDPAVRQHGAQDPYVSPPTSPGMRRTRSTSRGGRLTEAADSAGHWRASSPPTTTSEAGNLTVDAIMDVVEEAEPPHVSADCSGVGGRMSGYYFHENSEPYQQLSLSHVSERSSSYFELR